MDKRSWNLQRHSVYFFRGGGGHCRTLGVFCLETCTGDSLFVPRRCHVSNYCKTCKTDQQWDALITGNKPKTTEHHAHCYGMSSNRMFGTRR